MPYDLDPNLCLTCPFGLCYEDRRNNPVPGRQTEFRVRQQIAVNCTFHNFVPGFDGDPQLGVGFNTYLERFRDNARNAGRTLVGDDFRIAPAALAKVEGDVAELLEAAALWNTAATWNLFMQMGQWVSRSLQIPERAVIDPERQVAILKLPRSYDATRLFTLQARAQIATLEAELQLRNMELGLSAPDIVGVRLPKEIHYREHPFSTLLPNLSTPNLLVLESAYRQLEGKIAQDELLFAIAIKRTMRSDRLYQPLFEANVLKYLLHGLLNSHNFKFYVHAWSVEGANVEGHYRAASLYSLMQQGQFEPERAVDRLVVCNDPIQIAQSVLDDLVLLTEPQ